MTTPRQPGHRDIPKLDVLRAHPARVHNALLGGKDNFAVDRTFAAQLLEAWPDARSAAEAGRDFVHRAVRYTVGEGSRQILDIGVGLPTETLPIHDIAQKLDPAARVVYADLDPFVLAHARALLADDQQHAYVIDADLRDPAGLLQQAGRYLDLNRPVTVVLGGILHLIPGDLTPLVTRLMRPLAAASQVVISHATADPLQHTPGTEQVRDALTRLELPFPVVPRSRTDLHRLLREFDLVEPGIVYLDQWRPDSPAQDPPSLADYRHDHRAAPPPPAPAFDGDGCRVCCYGVIARTPGSPHQRAPGDPPAAGDPMLTARP